MGRIGIEGKVSCQEPRGSLVKAGHTSSKAREWCVCRVGKWGGGGGSGLGSGRFDKIGSNAGWLSFTPRVTRASNKS